MFYSAVMIAATAAVVFALGTLASYAFYWIVVLSFEHPEQTAWLLQWL